MVNVRETIFFERSIREEEIYIVGYNVGVWRCTWRLIVRDHKGFLGVCEMGLEIQG